MRLLNDDLHKSGDAGEQERRDGMRPGNRMLGRVVACNGSRATIAAVAADGGTDLTELWSVGRLISISVGKNRVVALAYSMQTEGKDWGEGADNQFITARRGASLSRIRLFYVRFVLSCKKHEVRARPDQALR